MVESNFSMSVFCPMCSTEREKPQFSVPTGRILWIAALSGLLVGTLTAVSFSTWLGVWLGFVSAVLCFSTTEVYYTFKFRGELECPVCHFDPILYRRSPDEAKKRCLDGLKGKDPVFLSKWQALREQGAQ